MINICYKTNPIVQAITRIDFLNIIDDFTKEIPIELGSKIKNYFPIAESKETVSRELKIGPGEKWMHDIDRFPEWNFFDKSRNNRLCITKKTMFIVHKKYTNEELFLSDFRILLNAIYDKYPDLQIKRFGMRYINHIKIEEDGPFDWEKYLNENLIAIFKVPEDKTKISRAFNNLELNCSDYTLKFQYGMYNQDYPATIKKKLFILDIDAYYDGIMTKTDIEEFIPIFHNEIQKLFENSIKDEYRSILNDEK